MREDDSSSKWDEMKPKKKSKTFDLIEDKSSKTSIIKPTQTFRVEEEDEETIRSSSRTPREEHKPKKKKQESFEMRHLRTMESINENIRTVTLERKWLASFVIAVIACLIFSTFTVGILDQYFFKRGIDLFSKDNRRNELILNAIQFLLLFVLVRVVFNYV